MSTAPLRPLALGGEPLAVLLLDTSPDALPDTGGGPPVLAADAAALALTGSRELPADLRAFLLAAGFGDLHRTPPDSPWRRVAARVDVPGEPLPDAPGPGWWLRSVGVDGLGRTLLTVQQLEGAETTTPAENPVVAGPGSALSVCRDGLGGLVVEWVDEGWVRTTGTPAADVVGRPCHHLLRDPDPAALTRWRACVAGSRPGHVTALDHRADGSAFVHRVSTTPLADRDGRVRHVVSWHSDATSRIAAEDAARTHDQRSAHRLELLRRLDSVVVADPAGGVEALVATVRLLTEDVVEDALLALTVPRPGGPRGVDVEVVAAAGPRFAAFAGHRLRRSRGPRPADPLLRPPDGARAEPVDLLALDADPVAPSGWLAVLAASAGAPQAHAVPMVGRDEVVGLLVVVPRDGTGPGLPPADAAVLVGAARRAGLLVENAGLHAREHDLARRLRQTTPASVDALDGLDVWSVRTGDDGSSPSRGGDWYEVLQTGPETAVIAVGDVGAVGGVTSPDPGAAGDGQGPGTPAAGRIRAALRTAAGELDDPAALLHRVDLLAGDLHLTRTASLVLAHLHRLQDGGWEVAWSSAGHLPPLLRRAPGPDGAARVEVLSEATGTVLGVGARPRPTRERALGPGDTLVLYTDGLIESRSRPDRDGLEVLVEALVGSGAADAAATGGELLAGLRDASDERASVVVVRVPLDTELDAVGRPLLPADTPRRRRWQLPAEASSVGKARHATLRACAVWGLDTGLQAEMVVSELVANAVLHGWGTVDLRLFDQPTGLRVEVEDDSPEAPRLVPPRPDGGGGHGMRVVERLGRWGWTPTRRGKIVWVELHPAPTPAPPPAPVPDPVPGRTPQ